MTRRGHNSLSPEAIKNGNGRTEVSTYDTVKVPGSLLLEIVAKVGEIRFWHEHFATLDEFLASVKPDAEYDVYLSEV